MVATKSYHLAAAMAFGLVLVTAFARGDEWDMQLEWEGQFNELFAAGRHREAEPIARRMVANSEANFADEPDSVAPSSISLGRVLEALGRYREAEAPYRRALAVWEAAYGRNHPKVAIALLNLGVVEMHLLRFADADRTFKRALAIYKGAGMQQTPDNARVLCGQGMLFQQMGKLDEAAQSLEASVETHLKTQGALHYEVAQSLHNLASVYIDQARLKEAEEAQKVALQIQERVEGTDHPHVGESLNNLAVLYIDEGRLDDAEPLVRRSLAIHQKAFGPQHVRTAGSMYTLGFLAMRRGRYADAEALFKQLIPVWEKDYGPEHAQTALAITTLSQIYLMENRIALASELNERALKIREKVLGKDHLDVAQSLFMAAVFLEYEDRYAEAQPLRERSLAIDKKVLGADHPRLARSLCALARNYAFQQRFAEAEALNRRALELQKRVLGLDHPDVWHTLSAIADASLAQDNFTLAKQTLDQQIELAEKAKLSSALNMISYQQRAKTLRALKQPEAAIADLQKALDLAELTRSGNADGETERAQLFAMYAEAFELMIDWQFEAHNVAEVLAAAERSRARSLVDQLEFRGSDMLAGLPTEQARQLRQQAIDAKVAVASVEKQIDKVREHAAESERSRRQLDTLNADLMRARERVVEAYRAIRNQSPAYRLTVAQGFKPVTLDEISEWLNDSQSALLEYIVGSGHCYLLYLTPHQQPEIIPLVIDEPSATLLTTKAGPLTADTLRSLLSDSGGHVIGSRPSTADVEEGTISQTARLAALCDLLVPSVVRSRLLHEAVKQIVVVPDGPLGLLPLEILVVEASKNPKYLLDVAAPIVYAPSATVLRNLAGRAATAAGAAQPVLCVADPAYPQAASVASLNGTNLDTTAANAEFRSGGRTLNRLPFAAMEARWVADVFKKHGIGVDWLVDQMATEANVRGNVSGRSIVHFACHGLADEAHGNLFGALALAPGKRAGNPSDDGFLSLDEIYELDLKACELSILSACETNFGPEQRGEGVWALSRGFLVAGSRRVVASNWLVDDEAAASLVSYFCSLLAKAQKAGQPGDYAGALLKAKRWVRAQEKWGQPHYWGTFVLVGPN